MPIKDTIIVSASRARVEHHVAANVRVVAIRRFEKGYYPQRGFDIDDIEFLNGGEAPTEVIESAVAASMFGWDAPVSRKAHAWLEERDRRHNLATD